MKTIIFSDLHANIFGLNKILEFARTEQIEHIYCLGDIVGYHSYPAECIRLLKNHAIPAIKGNHEALLLGEIGGWNRISVRANHSLTRTRRLLTAEEIRYLTRLPFSLAIDTPIHLVHANYDNLTQTVNTPEKARQVFIPAIAQDIHLTFLGHTHRPGAYMTDKAMREVIPVNLEQPLSLRDDMYYIVNPGSAGESRHNLPLSFVVYNHETRSITLEIIKLSRKEVNMLKQHNREIFGLLSLTQKMAQVKEKLRRFYYALQKK